MMTNNTLNPMWELEIRVLSCEGLNLITQSSSSSSFSSWWSSFIFTPTNSKPMHFISVTKLPDHEPKVYSGRLLEEDEGAAEGSVLRVPADSIFLSDTQSCLYLQIYQKRRILGPTQVGWCLVPVSDIGPPPPPHPPPPVRCLSYRLRGRDGCVGGAIINLSIQLRDKCEAEAAAPVIGIPIGTTEEGHIKSEC